MNNKFANVNEYGKLDYADVSVEIERKGKVMTVFYPTEATYNSIGYYRVNRTYIPECEDGYHAVPTGKWELVDNECRRMFTIEEDEEIPRVFSRLKMYLALAKAGLWDGVEAWLKAQTIEGISLYMAFNLANEISEDHELFAPFLKSAQTALGVDDATVEAILNASVLEV